MTCTFTSHGRRVVVQTKTMLDALMDGADIFHPGSENNIYGLVGRVASRDAIVDHLMVHIKALDEPRSALVKTAMMAAGHMGQPGAEGRTARAVVSRCTQALDHLEVTQPMVANESPVALG